MPGAEDELPPVVRPVALERVDVHAGERLGRLGRDLLDVDAAARREHQQRRARTPVERDREVVLLRDLGGALDPQAPHDVAADVEAEDRARVLLGLVRAGRDTDAAGLPAPAGQHLRLDDDGPPSSSAAARASSGVVARRPVRGRDAEAPEHLLALVLVEIHRRRL